MGTGTLYVTQKPWIILQDWWRVQKRPLVTIKEAEYLAERLMRPKAVVPFLDYRVNLNVGRSTLRGVRVIGSTAEWTLMAGLEPKASFWGSVGRMFLLGYGYKWLQDQFNEIAVRQPQG